MSIREGAVAAWQAKVDGWAQSAAGALTVEGGVLWDASKNGPAVAAKDLVEVHRDYPSRLVVFTGPEADVHLSVREERDRWEVRLVELVDGGWTGRSEPLTSLAELGEVLA